MERNLPKAEHQNNIKVKAGILLLKKGHLVNLGVQ